MPTTWTNLEEINKFLETYNLTKLSQEETDNLNRPVNRSEIKYVMKTKPSLKKKVQDWMVSMGNFTKHRKKNLYLNF